MSFDRADLDIDFNADSYLFPEDDDFFDFSVDPEENLRIDHILNDTLPINSKEISSKDIEMYIDDEGPWIELYDTTENKLIWEIRDDTFLISWKKYRPHLYLEVNPDYRRKGYGQKLYDLFCDNFPDEDHDIEYSKKRSKISLYMKNGFEITGIYKDGMFVDISDEEKNDFLQSDNEELDQIYKLNK